MGGTANDNDNLLGDCCSCWRQLAVLPSTGSNTSWVYRAVNETALLSIAAPLIPGNSYYVIWTKGGQRLVQLRGTNTKYFVNREQCRCAMLRNGTLQIQRLQKEDSGNYTVMVYQDGKLKAEENTIFFVQGEFLLFPYHSQLNKTWYSLLSPAAFPTQCPPF